MCYSNISDRMPSFLSEIHKMLNVTRLTMVLVKSQFANGKKYWNKTPLFSCTTVFFIVYFFMRFCRPSTLRLVSVQSGSI